MARLVAWLGRRRFGVTLDPLSAAGHHPGVLWVSARLALGVQRRWNRLDPTLRCLATLAPAARIGCSWCMDFGYWHAHHQGVDPAKIDAVPEWRESTVYSDLERRVLEYAEAMTETPPAVTDEMVAGLRERLTDAQVVELTASVALENMWSRTNSALGLESQGFKATCALPAPAGGRREATPYH